MELRPESRTENGSIQIGDIRRPGGSWTIDVTIEVLGEGPDPSGSFLRGDANADRAFDLTDVIFTHSYLFTGGRVPDCAKSADADDNGAVEITDAIAALECGRFPPCE